LKHAVIIAAAVFLFAGQAAAVEPATLDDVLHQRAQAFVENTLFGVAVGVFESGTEHTVFAGHQSIGGPPPDQNTLFELGSVTKTFTGLLLADAVGRNEVKLDQPIAELLGPNASVPRFDDREIHLVDLATQTSGLPRLPTNMGLLVNPLNPYSGYTVDDLNKFLAKYKLEREPGKEYEYSNLGMGLLGNGLATRAGKTYEELVQQRICGPLGMTDTVIALSDAQTSRMASGFDLLGLPTMHWDVPALPGCGAIRSTLHDMLIYLRANLSPDSTPLAKAIALSHEPRFKISKSDTKPAKKLEIGLAWHITTEGDNKIIWHNGMTGGYSALVALEPDDPFPISVPVSVRESVRV